MNYSGYKASNSEREKTKEDKNPMDIQIEMTKHLSEVQIYCYVPGKKFIIKKKF